MINSFTYPGSYWEIIVNKKLRSYICRTVTRTRLNNKISGWRDCSITRSNHEIKTWKQKSQYFLDVSVQSGNLNSKYRTFVTWLQGGLLKIPWTTKRTNTRISTAINISRCSLQFYKKKSFEILEELNFDKKFLSIEVLNFFS